MRDTRFSYGICSTGVNKDMACGIPKYAIIYSRANRGNTWERYPSIFRGFGAKNNTYDVVNYDGAGCGVVAVVMVVVVVLEL